MSATIRRLALCALAVVLVSPAAAEDHFQVTHLAPDLLLLSTDQGSYSNNSLVFTGDDGLLLVDTHHDADREAFRRFVEDLGYGAPKYIISTHRHVEHIGGNDLFGAGPVVVAHHRFADKLRSGTFLFSEYPPEAFPDVAVTDSLEIAFNGEIIRLVDIGGSHDDNEILVHFTKHRIAHVSSVVNGFNFPSVDGDGDALRFEELTRRLMSLLPHDVRLVSGHHGRAAGYDVVGEWEQLPAYAEMMKASVEIVRQGLAEGRTEQELQEAGVLDGYAEYAGSYVDADGWIHSLVDALTVPRDTRDDICRPLYRTWKQDGAAAAVALYGRLLETREPDYDFSDFVLLGIGSKLLARGLHEDAAVFLLGCDELYPEAEYAYYGLYLAARALRAAGRPVEALEKCRKSLELNPDFAGAAGLLEELSASDGG